MNMREIKYAARGAYRDLDRLRVIENIESIVGVNFVPACERRHLEEMRFADEHFRVANREHARSDRSKYRTN
jgi:hypothetical protein